MSFDFLHSKFVQEFTEVHQLNVVNNTLINGLTYMKDDGTFDSCEGTQYPNLNEGWLKSWCGIGIRLENGQVSRIKEDFGKEFLC